MKISVVTTTFNSEKTVADTIESVLAQTHKDIEYIVVDGASKDSTMDIVKKYESAFEGKIKYVSERDTGIYNAMNKGLQMATGDVVGTLNSDDFFADNSVLETINNAFETSNTDCVFANLLLVDAKDTNKVIREFCNGEYRKNAFQKGWHPAHPTFYAKTELYKKFGYFNETLRIAADFELMLRFIEKNKITTKYIDKVFVKQRAGGVSTQLSGYIKSNIEVLKAFKLNGMRVPLLCVPRKILPKLINGISHKISRTK